MSTRYRHERLALAFLERTLNDAVPRPVLSPWLTEGNHVVEVRFLIDGAERQSLVGELRSLAQLLDGLDAIGEHRA